MNELIAATLITESPYENLTVPNQLWPSGCDDDPMAADAKIRGAGQMIGTIREKLMELAGRSCYDSLGQGRSSDKYHEHIQEVGHLSVCEHAQMTFHARMMNGTAESWLALMAVLAIHPEIEIQPEITPGMSNIVTFTLNVRTILEWDVWSASRRMSLVGVPNAGAVDEELIKKIRLYAHEMMPQVVADPGPVDLDDGLLDINHCNFWENPDHQWISMFLSGSRGFSHEMVRHGNWTAISQRSTRYVDESGSSWVLHPLIDMFMAENNDFEMLDAVNSQNTAKTAYDTIVDHLQPWLIARGVDKFTARKQSRGAARGFLGNALYTEMVFSASVAQWRRIFMQRVHPAADAEIRELGAKALTEIKEKSQLSGYFADMELIPSSDGIGQVLDLESVQA